MSKQTDYTPEEWKSISAAPVMAGLLVTVSDLSGPIGTANSGCKGGATLTTVGRRAN